MKVIGLINPCHRPSQNPAAPGPLARSFGPAAQEVKINNSPVITVRPAARHMFISRSGAARHGPKVFGAYRPAADHQFIDLKAANGELLCCGVADPETSHGHRAYRQRADRCGTGGNCTGRQRPQGDATSSHAFDSDASDFDRRQISGCALSMTRSASAGHHVPATLMLTTHTLPLHDALLCFDLL
jgi:hypothetical protein